MWMGIVVLCAFGFAALACLVLAVRGALEGKWHVAVALLLPGLVLGGSIATMVGPTVSLALFGNPDLEDVPVAARQVPGGELRGLFAGTTHSGTYYDDGAWLVYEESYSADGDISGRGGPAEDPDSISWSGTWSVAEDEVCFDYGDEGTDCGRIFRLGDRYLEVNGHDEVEVRFEVRDTPPEDGAGSEI